MIEPRKVWFHVQPHDLKVHIFSGLADGCQIEKARASMHFKKNLLTEFFVSSAGAQTTPNSREIFRASLRLLFSVVDTQIAVLVSIARGLDLSTGYQNLF